MNNTDFILCMVIAWWQWVVKENNRNSNFPLPQVLDQDDPGNALDYIQAMISEKPRKRLMKLLWSPARPEYSLTVQIPSYSGSYSELPKSPRSSDVGNAAPYVATHRSGNLTPRGQKRFTFFETKESTHNSWYWGHDQKKKTHAEAVLASSLNPSVPITINSTKDIPHTKTRKSTSCCPLCAMIVSGTGRIVTRTHLVLCQYWDFEEHSSELHPEATKKLTTWFKTKFSPNLKAVLKHKFNCYSDENGSLYKLFTNAESECTWDTLFRAVAKETQTNYAFGNAISESIETFTINNVSEDYLLRHLPEERHDNYLYHTTPAPTFYNCIAKNGLLTAHSVNKQFKPWGGGATITAKESMLAARALGNIRNFIIHLAKMSFNPKSSLIGELTNRNVPSIFKGDVINILRQDRCIDNIELHANTLVHQALMKKGIKKSQLSEKGPVKNFIDENYYTPINKKAFIAMSEAAQAVVLKWQNLTNPNVDTSSVRSKVLKPSKFVKKTTEELNLLEKLQLRQYKMAEKRHKQLLKTYKKKIKLEKEKQKNAIFRNHVNTFQLESLKDAPQSLGGYKPVLSKCRLYVYASIAELASCILESIVVSQHNYFVYDKNLKNINDKLGGYMKYHIKANHKASVVIRIPKSLIPAQHLRPDSQESSAVITKLNINPKDMSYAWITHAPSATTGAIDVTNVQWIKLSNQMWTKKMPVEVYGAPQLV
ncbi:MAG: hypothetical protein GY750_12385 [Lentisphaerae bacterium]|nr:hypothetical protein [Lentisphaerota bacterium]MCP4102212.1 hypothetical protein [Lentisphaerota bacterium]